ncbi:hypothetical protein L484_002702 [Morus notabilis]|uniref:Uncharacterized protein n=1 Tax=Morus notabilis TaxID=981085 RepID=W9RTG2_9ROSA|nr:hypothetical protein L484_002702 [Morus notabilis]
MLPRDVLSQIILYAENFNWIKDRIIDRNLKAELARGSSHILIVLDLTQEEFHFINVPQQLLKFVKLARVEGQLSIFTYLTIPAA